MDTHNFIKAAREKGKAARRRRLMFEELQRFCGGGALAIVGLLLAMAYCLLTHQLVV